MSDVEAIKYQYEALRHIMDERMRRLWAAAEARAAGYGGVSRVAAATGISCTTITTGMCELDRLEMTPGELPHDPDPAREPRRRSRPRIRQPGAAVNQWR